LSLQNILDIIELFLNIKPHLQFIIEDKLYVYKSYNFITFRTDEYQVKEYNFEITDFGEYKLPNGDLISITKNANKNYGFIYKLCYNNLDLVFPLTVRNRLDGDRLKLSSGTKKLKDVFIDKKVPMLDRDSLPIFVNKNDEIVYIPGIYKMNSQGENSLYIIVRKD
jgi:tRNA(Ile)-lysidine synthase